MQVLRLGRTEHSRRSYNNEGRNVQAFFVGL